MRVLVTGANGFIGQPLSLFLTKHGYQIRSVVRVARGHFLNKEIRKRKETKDFVAVGSIDSNTDWTNVLQDIDAVIHLAARVHKINDGTVNPLAAFQEVNTTGTEHLARESAKIGVRRFVYLSTVKVNGEETGLMIEESGPRDKKIKKIFLESDIPNPQDPYAVSKWEAEQILHAISKETGMEIVIVRPPLVYGPGVKANFLRLLQVIDRGIPLPLSSVNNSRSLVSLDNLIDFLITCLKYPAAAGETFFVSDGDDLSTPELIRKIAQFMNRPCRLLPFPTNMLHFLAKLVDKESVVNRLCDSLQVDISKARNVLGWEPPVSIDEGLKKTVKWYKNRTEC